MNRLNHVAIIMDGNGRWGLKKGRSRNYGHLKGLKAVETVIKSSIKQQIPLLTLYTFSTENWKRPENEINFLFDLIRKSLKKNLEKIVKQGIKVNIIGKKLGLPKDISNTIRFIEKRTLNNKTINLNLALNYGSKEEIISACKKISIEKNKNINIKNFEKKHVCTLSTAPGIYNHWKQGIAYFNKLIKIDKDMVVSLDVNFRVLNKSAYTINNELYINNNRFIKSCNTQFEFI